MTEVAGTIQRLVAIRGVWYCCGCEEPLVNGKITHLVSCGDVPVSGAALSRMQIAKHRTDRYPAGWAQACKVNAELRELLYELDVAEYGAADGTMNDRIKAEFADVGLSLFALGNKLGLDLIECMRELVSADERTFT
jgi:hypothetical protein